MATPRTLRLVAASFLGGGLLAFVALCPWSRGLLPSGASPESSSFASDHAPIVDRALDAAAWTYTQDRTQRQAAAYLQGIAHRVTEWARAEEEARQRAAEEARRRAQEALAAELAAARPPEGVSFGPDEHWITVNLTTQRAIAFIGAQPVHLALVTTGAPGWETPTGDFRIYVRIENETMDSLSIGIPRDDPWGYYLEDVLFTQYFVGGVALHYNYWRGDSYFGNVPSSHGCVGMRYDDAKFFWDFATTGTRVVVHY
jgi:lipoprotein-anchoring transpeptidase ErfK/SrfK